jgi:hypothetical protein
MKKIYFDDISNFRKKLMQKSIFLIGVSCILFGYFYETMNEIQAVWISRTRSFGFLLFTIYFINKVIRKNYVQWNKIGMTVRINNYFQEERISFNKIASYEFLNDLLRIFQSDKTIDIDLKDSIHIDKDKLIQILSNNTGVNKS